MITISFRAAEAALAALWLLCRAAVWLRRKTVDWKREALLLLMYVNLAVILRVTFFPMYRVGGRIQPLLFHPAAIFPLRINWVPFVRLKDFADRREMLLNVVGNVCLFIPSGVLLPLLDRRLDRFWKVVGAGALMSLGVELLQLPFSVRSTDIDDLIMNTCGAAIGCGVICLLRRDRLKKQSAARLERSSSDEKETE